MCSELKQLSTRQAPQADERTRQTALSNRDTDFVVNALVKHWMRWLMEQNSVQPSINLWSQSEEPTIKGQMRLCTHTGHFYQTHWPHFTALQKKKVCVHAWHISMFSVVTLRAAERVVSALSKQLCSIQCLYNEQSIIYSWYKHSQPWMEAEASGTQNGTNWAGALTVVGNKFLLGLCNYFLGLLSRSSSVQWKVTAPLW